MLEKIKDYKNVISERVIERLSEFEKKLKNINRWGEDVVNRLKNFLLLGKFIRGGLVLFTEEMYSGKFSPAAIDIAVSCELFQAGLLIHDDIMDQDTMRRQNKTIFYQYKEVFDELTSESYHFGESMGICAGDIAYFLGFDNLSQIDIDKNILIKIIGLFSREMVYVGLGQMQDVYYSSTDKELNEDKILSIYLYKTARYTFSLPLMAGAMLAGIPNEEIRKLEALGENFGIVFQIKDDELGMFGSYEKIGKPIGSDIQEKKKTFYYYYLNELANQRDFETIKNIYSKKEIDNNDVEVIRNLIEKYKIQEKINEKLCLFSDFIRDGIKSLTASENYKKELFEFLDYNLTRNF
ncbi:MAG: polyprenyl synthetase family protein [Brevinematales bacterium]|nr:polyprenyl synthetase family protein [Brevinematales bacterium]